jgi:hypothetical protein
MCSGYLVVMGAKHDSGLVGVESSIGLEEEIVGGECDQSG